jgi:hypothetical protein
MDTQDVQRRYWDQFARLKRDAIYISRYHSRVETIDRWINIFTAIMSSTAIAGWAIWNHIGWAWGAAIAVSQVISAVKPYLPFQKRKRMLAKFGADLETLALAAEADWMKVARLTISEEEIHNRTMTLKRKCLAAQNRAFAGASLPEKVRWVEAADRDAAVYMNSYVTDEG